MDKDTYVHASDASAQFCGCDAGAGHYCEQHMHCFEDAPPLVETRVVDSKTGGEKGSKLARFSLIPAQFTWALAVHFGVGARKYDDRNWERGYKWSLSLDALERHLSQWKQGEVFDRETGSHHLICVAWHACALFIFWKRQLGTNDIYQEAA